MKEFHQKIFDATGQFFIPYQWDWGGQLLSFLQCYPQYFDEWFSHDWINVYGKSEEFCTYVPQHFKTWFRPDQFDWEKSSIHLVEYCIKDIDTWVTYDNFNWDQIKECDNTGDRGDNIIKVKHEYVMMELVK